MDVMEQIGQSGIVPVVVIEDAASAVPTAWALLDGGIRTMEITFRTPAAGAIQAVAKCPGYAGRAEPFYPSKGGYRPGGGRSIIVSPGVTILVATASWKAFRSSGLCVTPTEIIAALSRGLTILKFFPPMLFSADCRQ